MAEPTLTLILCSRNDQYMGNSRWRLEITLNYVAEQVRVLGRTDAVEILVADWGSEQPLASAVRLNQAAASMVSFVRIPPAIARPLQRDSPFPEVLALNAAARRARGEYIGRIDQDTLVGARFLREFFALHERRTDAPFDVRTTLMFSQRRSVPFRLVVPRPPLAYLARMIGDFGSRLTVERAPSWAPFYLSSVGIWLAHRTIWEECGGYDEEMIYMGAMESHMIARLMKTHALVDLGRLVGHDFFHLEHHEPWARRSCWADRRPNDDTRGMDTNFAVMNPTGPRWGLVDCELPIDKAPPSPAAVPLAEASSQRYWSWLAAIGVPMLVENALIALSRVPEKAQARLRVFGHRVAVIRALVRGKPLSQWTQVIGERLAHPERGPLVYPRNILDVDADARDAR